MGQGFILEMEGIEFWDGREEAQTAEVNAERFINVNKANSNLEQEINPSPCLTGI